MSSIKISELRPAGSELFDDSESFLHELTEQESRVLAGGAVVAQVSVNVGIPSNVNDGACYVYETANTYAVVTVCQSENATPVLDDVNQILGDIGINLTF